MKTRHIGGNFRLEALFDEADKRALRIVEARARAAQREPAGPYWAWSLYDSERKVASSPE